MRQKYFLRNDLVTSEKFGRPALLGLRHDNKKNEMMIVGSKLFEKDLKLIAALPQTVSSKRRRKEVRTDSWRYRVKVLGVYEAEFELVKEEIERMGWDFQATSNFGRLCS